MTNYTVVWRGPLAAASGLGIASREYVRALRRQGAEVRVGEAGSSPKDSNAKSKGRKVLIYHYPPHTWDITKQRKYFDRIILNTVWETTRIPKRWIPHMNKFDAVFVPSKQNRQAMRDSGVKKPIFLVPHGVNVNEYRPGHSKLALNSSKGRFVFISVFGFQHRKNPEALLRAYWEQFSHTDKVLLIIKTNGYAPYENEAWIKNRIQQYKKRLGIRKKTAPVLIIGRRLQPGLLKQLYALGDAFVLPTRGEGVGLPFLEAMASGVPVIATGWGGHMDFLTGRNSFFVNYTLRNPAAGMNSRHSISRQFRRLFAEKGQRWAEPDIGSLKRQMWLAYKNPDLCKRKGRQGRQDALKLSWSRAGASMKRALDQLVRS